MKTLASWFYNFHMLLVSKTLIKQVDQRMARLPKQSQVIGEMEEEYKHYGFILLNSNREASLIRPEKKVDYRKFI